MKNKLGKTGGFLLGVTSFLLAFKLLVLDRISPDDELAPGVVVLLAILNGILFGYLGNFLQNRENRNAANVSQSTFKN